jgi:hypothetical protein
MTDEKLITSQQIESGLVVAAAHRMQFEGPIATYIITGTDIELWDAHGRYCKTTLLPEPARKPKKETSQQDELNFLKLPEPARKPKKGK